MSFYLNAAFSLSIGIGAIVGFIRHQKTVNDFVPFLLLLWTGLINEVISICLAMNGYSNVVNYNVFALLEGVLIFWQFRRWGLFKKMKIYLLVQLILFSLWFYETILLTNIFTFNSIYLILYSFAIVLFSIYTITEMFFYEGYQLLRNPKFLICLGMTIYFTYSVLTEIFWMFGLNRSNFFKVNIYQMLAYINLFTNLIYAVAFLWIPMKQRYMQLFL